MMTLFCHRVVNRNGLLTGNIIWRIKYYEKLLENEGIKINENQIKNFSYHFWNPNIELGPFNLFILLNLNIIFESY